MLHGAFLLWLHHGARRRLVGLRSGVGRGGCQGCVNLKELNRWLVEQMFEIIGGQAEMAVHMLNWAIRSVKFLGVEFDQSEDEEVSVSDTTHL